MNPPPAHESTDWCAPKSPGSLVGSDTATLVAHWKAFCHLLRVNQTGSSNVALSERGL